MSEESASGKCPKCLQPFDNHCLMHEPVPLCPIVVGGAFKTPCEKTGPKGAKK